MRFVNLEQFVKGRPTVEIVSAGSIYDLHNDGVLRSLAYVFEERILHVGWTLHEAAWRVPSLPEPKSRRVVAELFLQFAEVSEFRIHGSISAEYGEQVLDFLEYSTPEAELGEVRFVLHSGVELLVRASECKLLLSEESHDTSGL